jgi:hypothetical protein
MIDVRDDGKVTNEIGVHELSALYLVLCTWCFVLGALYLVLCTWSLHGALLGAF